MKPSCQHPFVRDITQDHDDLGFPLKMVFPCGKCPICLSNDSKDWTLRLQMEQQNSINSKFITLTYNEHNIVLHGTTRILVKRDLQLFIKRLRQRIADKFPDFPKLRFFAVGEYGPTTARPHYHAILFNLPDNFNLHRLIEDCWNKGFITVSDITPGRISYVSSYSLFGFLFNSMADPEIPRPFRVMSRRPGIGSSWITPRRSEYYSHRPEGIIFNGFTYRYPRYFKDKIFSTEESKQFYQDNACRHHKQQANIYHDMYGHIDSVRLSSGLPTIQEEFEHQFLANMKKQYVIHKLHKKL